MSPENLEIYDILEQRLREIYEAKFIKTEIQGIMRYPLKESLYIVTYNLELQGSLPIRRAKILVDTATEELKRYDPGLL